MSEKKFDADGVLVTDQNYEGDTRGFDDLSQDERESFFQTQRDEVKKFDAILERKGKKVAGVNAILDDEEVVDKKPEETEQVNNASDKGRMDRMDLAIAGYTPEVVEHIMALGGKEALQNPLIKSSADAMVKQSKAVEAADITSGPTSAVDKKYTQDDLDKMTSAELAKVLPHAE